MDSRETESTEGDRSTDEEDPGPEIGRDDALPRRPLLAGLYHVVPLSPSRVEIVNAGRSIALNGENFADKVMPLLDRMDGRTSLDDIKSEFPDLAVPVVKALVQRKMVTDAAPEADTARSAPEAAGFAFLDLASSAETAERLAAARVLVAGCGPVGAQVAVVLAKAGVGSILLADDEDVSASDIAASAVLRPQAEGRQKMETVAQLLEEAGGSKVQSLGSPLTQESVSGATLGIAEIGYASDDAETAADHLLWAGIPLLPFSQDAFEAVVGPLVGPGGEPCHRCVEARRQSHLAHLDEYRAYRKHRSRAAPRADAFLAAHTSIVAGTVATEALRAIIRGAPAERHIAIIFDLAQSVLEKEEVFLIPTCPACEKAGRWAPGKEVDLARAEQAEVRRELTP